MQQSQTIFGPGSHRNPPARPDHAAPISPPFSGGVQRDEVGFAEETRQRRRRDAMARFHRDRQSAAVGIDDAHGETAQIGVMAGAASTRELRVGGIERGHRPSRHDGGDGGA
jgi:hypothetical protein